MTTIFRIQQNQDKPTIACISKPNKHHNAYISRIIKNPNHLFKKRQVNSPAWYENEMVEVEIEEAVPSIVDHGYLEVLPLDQGAP